MKIILFACLISASAFAADPSDSLLRGGGTQRVAPSGGDTIATYSVVCPINSVTAIRAANTDRSRRRLCFFNDSSVIVAIGSATAASGNLWRLGESTNTAVIPSYCTNSSGLFYCSSVLSPVSSATVRVIEETQSIP